MGKIQDWRSGWGSWVATAIRPAWTDGVVPWWQASRRALTGLVFPPHCLLCGRELTHLCERFCPTCSTALAAQSHHPCPRCARPVPPHTRSDPDGCLECARKKLWFDRAVALGIYGGALRELVLRTKKARHESLSLAVGQWLADRVAERIVSPRPDLVIPVPMHWLRRLLRGVNGAELLAEAIAGRLRIPFRAGHVVCWRRTRKQGTLTVRERATNVRGAYAVRRPQNVRDLHVLLVDDVMTTGATANEVARVLRRAGARTITVAVIARGAGFR